MAEQLCSAIRSTTRSQAKSTGVGSMLLPTKSRRHPLLRSPAQVSRLQTMSESLACDRLGLYYASVSSAPQTGPEDECILKFVHTQSSKNTAGPQVLDSDFSIDKGNFECIRLREC